VPFYFGRASSCSPPLECIFWIFRLYFPVPRLFLPISRYLSIYLAILLQYPLYPTVSHCIHYISLVSHYIQLYLLYLLYPAVSHCISPYLPASKTGYNQKYTPGGGYRVVAVVVVVSSVSVTHGAHSAIKEEGVVREDVDVGNDVVGY